MNRENAWAWQRECADQEGRHLVEFEVMEGPDKGKKLYKGKIQLNVHVQVVKNGVPVLDKNGKPETKEQAMPFEFDFPEGKGLSHCKNHFDDIAKSAIKEWEAAQKQARESKEKEVKGKQSKIITPGGGGQLVLGPNGRPLL